MAERSVRGSVVKALAAEATRRKREKDESNESPTEEEGPRRSRPRRACRDAPVQTLASTVPAAAAASQPSLPLKGKLLVIHANTKTYGRGGDTASAGDDHRLVAAKRSNREDFKFAAKDYIAMRDGGVYSGDPRENKLLPLPRPTYTEFINRAQRAKALDRLFFVFCPPDAPRLPRLDYRKYERVVYAGVSFRRFAKIWQPERHHFFKPQFQARVMAMLLARNRAQRSGSAFGVLPDELLHDILAFASSKKDARRDDYDDLATVNSGQRHLFLPAPGSSGIRDHLFDAVFGL